MQNSKLKNVKIGRVATPQDSKILPACQCLSKKICGGTELSYTTQHH